MKSAVAVGPLRTKTGLSSPGFGSAALCYGLAPLSVAVCLGVGLLAWQYGIRHQFSMFLFAVAITAWYGGLGPAIVAVICSSLAYDYFYNEPLYSFAVPAKDIPDYAVIVLFGLLVSWFGSVRRRTEDSLRRSQRKYRELIDASPDAIFVWDTNGNCLLSNTSAARLRGCREDELIGLSLADTYAPAERDLIRERFERVKKEGVVRFERQFLRKNNEVVPVDVSLSSAGEDHYQAVVRDISDRKKAEQELRKQAELLSLAHDAIIVRDPESRITFWNRGAEKTYAWSSTEAVGKVTHELLQTRFPVSRHAVDVALQEQGEWEGELTHLTRQGSAIVVNSRQSLRRDEHGDPAAILEINRDVTDRKQAEEQIHKMNEELEQRVIERTRELQAVNKELEAFAYSISHDLRAPVRHIAGFTELLRKHTQSVLDDKSRHHISMILDSANRMGSLVDDLLAFSRIGRAETQKTTVDLAQIVKGIVGELAPDTLGRNITWHVGDLPKCYGDPAMLRLVFTNLVSNALKFTRTRDQTKIEIGSLNHEPDEVVIFVKDNGVGFDMKYKDKLFGVFQRLHPQEAFEGTGIGLATVQRIVHRHGGKVWPESSVDHGATFYVALPKLGKEMLQPGEGEGASVTRKVYQNEEAV
jgi:PAS domain S-box-containing protein